MQSLRWPSGPPRPGCSATSKRSPAHSGQSCSIEASCAEFHEKLQQPNAFCWNTVKARTVEVKCSAAAAAAAPNGQNAAKQANTGLATTMKLVQKAEMKKMAKKSIAFKFQPLYDVLSSAAVFSVALLHY